MLAKSSVTMVIPANKTPSNRQVVKTVHCTSGTGSRFRLNNKTAVTTLASK